MKINYEQIKVGDVLEIPVMSSKNAYYVVSIEGNKIVCGSWAFLDGDYITFGKDFIDNFGATLVGTTVFKRRWYKFLLGSLVHNHKYVPFTANEKRIMEFKN